jgi:hypothetical protein
MMLHEIVVTQCVCSTQHWLQVVLILLVGESANSSLSFVVFIKNVCSEELRGASILYFLILDVVIGLRIRSAVPLVNVKLELQRNDC